MKWMVVIHPLPLTKDGDQGEETDLILLLDHPNELFYRAKDEISKAFMMVR